MQDPYVRESTPPLPLRVLIVEDSPDDAALLEHLLRKDGYDVISERVDTAEAMRDALERQPWDLIISDHRMPKFSAPAALQVLKATGRDLPFIIVSGTIGDEEAVAAMKAGAHDYLIKGRLARLAPSVARELCDAEQRRQRRQAEKILQQQLAELRRWQSLILERSDRSHELKREVNELLRRLGEPIRYPSQAGDVDAPIDTATPPKED